ncbi:hypothetical protein GLOIN_2v1671665 [Rhizophagus irregularis DAOM 181602=DAOM 197198]|nr:hypothetical protein GLOIN_2v1671665 [Rhizophagus irregularis DAOM 181602=DAOM 197198]
MKLKNSNRLPRVFTFYYSFILSLYFTVQLYLYTTFFNHTQDKKRKIFITLRVKH